MASLVAILDLKGKVGRQDVSRLSDLGHSELSMALARIAELDTKKL